MKMANKHKRRAHMCFVNSINCILSNLTTSFTVHLIICPITLYTARLAAQQTVTIKTVRLTANFIYWSRGSSLTSLGLSQ